jgi:hypothetical protein
MSSTEDCLWSFGYGSNMDVKALEAKKHVKVLGKEFFVRKSKILAVLPTELGTFLSLCTYWAGLQKHDQL